MRSAAKASFEGAVLSFSVPFEAKMTDPPITDEQLASLVEREREGIRVSREMWKGQSEFQKRYDDALDGIEERVRRQAESYRIREVEGIYHRSGPLLGGDSIYEAKIEKGADPPYNVFLLERRLDEKKDLRSVMFDADARFVTVSANGASVGIPDLMFLGRLPNVFYAFYFDDTLPIAFEFDKSYEPENSGEVAVVFRVEKNGPTEGEADATEKGSVGRFVVNTERGYICPYFELNDPAGLLSKIVCDDFVQVGPGRDWYPTSATVSSRGSGGLQTASIKVRESGLSLNETLPQELFSIEVPAGTGFLYQLGSGMQASSVCSITVDIDGLPALPDHKCLQKDQLTPLSPGHRGNLGRFVIYVNVLLLLAIGAFFIFRKMRKQGL